MRRATPHTALLALTLSRCAIPAGHIIQCQHCGDHYDPSDIPASQPHNNPGMPGGCC